MHAVDFFLLRLRQRRSTYTLPGQRPLPSIKMCTPRDQYERRATLAAEVRTAVAESKGRNKEGYTREAYVTEMLRSATAATCRR